MHERNGSSVASELVHICAIFSRCVEIGMGQCFAEILVNEFHCAVFWASWFAQYCIILPVSLSHFHQFIIASYHVVRTIRYNNVTCAVVTWS